MSSHSLLTNLKGFVPESEQGWNVRPEWYPKVEEPNKNFSTWKRVLSQSPFHIMEHKSFENEHIDVISLIQIVNMDNNMILVRCPCPYKQETIARVLLPEFIKNTVALKKNYLESIKKPESMRLTGLTDAKGRPIKETDTAYFDRFVVNHINEYGINDLYNELGGNDVLQPE